MKTTKISAGEYKVNHNGLIYYISKVYSKWAGWRVVCGDYGNPNYWSDTFNTKKQAIEAILNDTSWDCSK